MERDPNISKLIREGGVVYAPEGFTGKVMDLITDKTGMQAYKPLIGKWGKLFIFLFLAAVVTVSIIFAGPADSSQGLGKFFADLNWQLPQINISLDFLSAISLPTISLPAGRLPTWIVPCLVAVFILVLIDTRFLKHGLL